MIVSGDRNIHVISAETFVLFDDHASVEDAGMQTNNYRTILIIRRWEWIYVFHCIREITGNTGPGFVVWRVKSMTNVAQQNQRNTPLPVNGRRHYFPPLSLSFELITNPMHPHEETCSIARVSVRSLFPPPPPPPLPFPPAILTSRSPLRFNHRKSNICLPFPVLTFISKTDLEADCLDFWLRRRAIGDDSDSVCTRNQTSFHRGEEMETALSQQPSNRLCLPLCFHHFPPIYEFWPRCFKNLASNGIFQFFRRVISRRKGTRSFNLFSSFAARIGVPRLISKVGQFESRINI